MMMTWDYVSWYEEQVLELDWPAVELVSGPCSLTFTEAWGFFFFFFLKQHQICAESDMCKRVCVWDKSTFFLLCSETNIQQSYTSLLFMPVTLLFSVIQFHSHRYHSTLLFFLTLSNLFAASPSLDSFCFCCPSSVPPSQTTCYSVQAGCRQHYSSSAYCSCRTTLFHPTPLSTPPPPLCLSVW